MPGEPVTREERLRADATLLAHAVMGIAPDRNTQTEDEAAATEATIAAAAKRYITGALATPTPQPAASAGRVTVLEEALRFYANPSNWSADGTILAPDPRCDGRPDCGATATAALAALPHPQSHGVRELLMKAREVFALSIAFVGRDMGTQRMSKTLSDLNAMWVEQDQEIAAALAASPQPQGEDLALVQAERDRLVRDLDVLLNGEGAAQQASLCDIVAQVRMEGIRSPKFLPAALAQPAPVAAGAVTEQMRAVLEAYEAWEGDLILNGDWSRETVLMTPEQQDRMVEIQAMRNAALSTRTPEGE